MGFVRAAAFATLVGAFSLGLAVVGAASGGLPLLPLETSGHGVDAVVGAASAGVGVLAGDRSGGRRTWCDGCCCSG